MRDDAALPVVGLPLFGVADVTVEIFGRSAWVGLPEVGAALPFVGLPLAELPLVGVAFADVVVDIFGRSAWVGFPEVVGDREGVLLAD